MTKSLERTHSPWKTFAQKWANFQYNYRYRYRDRYIDQSDCWKLKWDIIKRDVKVLEVRMTMVRHTLSDDELWLNILYLVCVEFFWPIRQPRWLPWPRIGWDTFNSSVTAGRNLMKFDQNSYEASTLLYQICVAGFFLSVVNPSTKMAAMAYDWMKHFRLLLCNRWRNSTGSKYFMISLNSVISPCWNFILL